MIRRLTNSQITPSNRPPAKQPVHAGGGGCVVIFGLIWTIFSLIFVILPLSFLQWEWETYTLLRDTGVPIEAVITERRIVSDDDGDSYRVTYQYSAPLPQGDRQRFVNEESVNKETYQNLTPETRVTVHYAPSDPATSRIGDDPGSLPMQIPFLGCFTLVGAFFVFTGVWQIVGGGRAMLKATGLARRGLVTRAAVTDRWIEKDSGDDPVYCVAYRFTPPGGTEIVRAEINRRAYEALEFSDHVSVRYYPNWPEICRIEL